MSNQKIVLEIIQNDYGAEKHSHFITIKPFSSNHFYLFCGGLREIREIKTDKKSVIKLCLQR